MVAKQQKHECSFVDSDDEEAVLTFPLIALKHSGY
jgi:hypothetical protein